MKISQILEELEFADDNAQILCSVSCVGLKSGIYIVGQILENFPGVVLGNREPHLREKTVGIFKKELAVFGSSFKESDFLIESAHEVNEQMYEIRFYRLTNIIVGNGEVILYSQSGEIEELRELHTEPEIE